MSSRESLARIGAAAERRRRPLRWASFRRRHRPTWAAGRGLCRCFAWWTPGRSRGRRSPRHSHHRRRRRGREEAFGLTRGRIPSRSKPSRWGPSVGRWVGGGVTSLRRPRRSDSIVGNPWSPGLPWTRTQRQWPCQPRRREAPPCDELAFGTGEGRRGG